MLTAQGFSKALAYWKLFLQGVACTVSLSALTVILGFILALVLAICRMGRSKILKALATAYVELFRATPMVVQIFIIFYVVFDGVKVLPGFKLYGFIRFDRFFPAVVALSLNSGAYLSEIIRSGIQSIDGGQTEAARSLGLSSWKTMRFVVLPQAIPHFLPSYKGQITALIKATAVVGYVAVQDLTKMGDIVRSRTYEAFFPLIAVAIIYFILAAILTFLVNRIEIRIDPRRRSKQQILKGVKTDD